MILKPLQKIQVIDSVKKHKAGSLGYLVAQDPWSSYNAWDMCVVFIRSGKRGIPKVDLSNIHPFMIDYNTMKQSDIEILNTVKLSDGLEPRLEATETVGDTSIVPLPTGPRDILELSDNEFMAYIISLSLAIYKIINHVPTRRLGSFPPYRFSRFVNNSFDLKIPAMETLGYHLLYGVKIDSHRRRESKRNNTVLLEGASFAECYNKQVNTRAKRKDLLDKLQLSFAMSQTEVKKYGIRINAAFSKTTQHVNDILKYYRRHKKELSKVKVDEALRGKVRISRGRPVVKKRLVPRKQKINPYHNVEG